MYGPHHIPSNVWMLQKSENDAGKATFHPLFYEHPSLSKRTVRWERGRGDNWVLFCHVYRGAEMRSRKKGSKQVNCSSFKKKYLGSCLRGSRLWVLKEWGEILYSQGGEPLWEEAECPDDIFWFPIQYWFFFLSSCQLISCTAWWTEVRVLKHLSCEAQSTLDPLWTWSSTWGSDEEWIDWNAWQPQSMPAMLGRFQSMATANPPCSKGLCGTCLPLAHCWQVGALGSPCPPLLHGVQLRVTESSDKPRSWVWQDPLAAAAGKAGRAGAGCPCFWPGLCPLELKPVGSLAQARAMQQKRLVCLAWLFNQEGIIFREELHPQVKGNARTDCQK